MYIFVKILNSNYGAGNKYSTVLLKLSLVTLGLERVNADKRKQGAVGPLAQRKFLGSAENFTLPYRIEM